MKIILNQDVYNLGEEGDVCEVANGYGRNFLLPQKMAVIYSKQNVAVFESRKAAIESRKEEKRKASASLKEQIEATTLELKVSSGDTGKLFGSVNNSHIAEELKAAGINIERKKIEIPEHTIKMLGEYTAKIKLYGNESADLKIIVKSNKEKPAEAETPVKAEKEAAPAAEAPVVEAAETETVEAAETEAAAAEVTAEAESEASADEAVQDEAETQAEEDTEESLED